MSKYLRWEAGEKTSKGWEVIDNHGNTIAYADNHYYAEQIARHADVVDRVMRETEAVIEILFPHMRLQLEVKEDDKQ